MVASCETPLAAATEDNFTPNHAQVRHSACSKSHRTATDVSDALAVQKSIVSAMRCRKNVNDPLSVRSWKANEASL
jgi:hypothetical protein